MSTAASDPDCARPAPMTASWRNPRGVEPRTACLPTSQALGGGAAPGRRESESVYSSSLPRGRTGVGRRRHLYSAARSPIDRRDLAASHCGGQNEREQPPRQPIMRAVTLEGPRKAAFSCHSLSSRDINQKSVYNIEGPSPGQITNFGNRVEVHINSRDRNVSVPRTHDLRRRASPPT